VDVKKNINRIYIAPRGDSFTGAGGRSDQCSAKASVNKKSFKSRFKYNVYRESRWSVLFVAASPMQTDCVENHARFPRRRKHILPQGK